MNRDKMTDSFQTERLVLFPYTRESLALFNRDLAAFEETYGVVYRGEELDYLLAGFLKKLEREIADDPEHYLFFTEFLIVLKENSHVIGSIDYKCVPRDGVTEVGYGLNPAYEGHGYMTEALRAFLYWGAKRGIRTVLADTLPDNLRSQNVLMRCGFRFLREDGNLWWEKRLKEPEETTMKEIPIQEIGPLKIGQAENAAAGTGCTVFVCEAGMGAGLDVRGGGPASRESQLLNPLAAAQTIHAVVLAGGSAFGLGAANGVMQCLEERGIGFDVGVTKVPLVAQSDLFDLTVGDAFTRPDAAMGYEAARRALDEPNYRDGNYGAGCGATVGKIAGMDTCMKTGMGSCAVQIGELKVGAVVALNALGDVFDWRTGRQIAGLLTEDRKGLRSTEEYMRASVRVVENRFTGNTTLAVVVTNAAFTKSQLCKIAGMAQDGYARSIRPVHTSADGDSIYALSVGTVQADQDLVGALAAETVSEAIIRAVERAESAWGFPAAGELGFDEQ